MKKTVRGKTYDTAEMAIVKKIAHGNFGDPAGYEETLYVAENGTYFLYTNGGEQSPYPTEKLVNLTKAKAQAWERKMHKAKSTEEQGNRGRFPFSFPPAKHPAALRGPRIAASEYGNIFRTVFFLRTFAKRSLAWYNVCKFRARVFAACAGSIL